MIVEGSFVTKTLPGPRETFKVLFDDEKKSTDDKEKQQQQDEIETCMSASPSIFAVTLIPDHDFIIGLEGKVIADVAAELFDDIFLPDDPERLSDLLFRIRDKHSTFLSPSAIISKHPHRVFVIP